MRLALIAVLAVGMGCHPRGAGEQVVTPDSVAPRGPDATAPGVPPPALPHVPGSPQPTSAQPPQQPVASDPLPSPNEPGGTPPITYRPDTYAPLPVLTPALLTQSVPPFGRSLFDHIVAQGPDAPLAVPFPFESLVGALTSRSGAGVLSALIPRGRSLLRAANAVDPFRFPRAIVGLKPEPPFGGSVFVAFVEPAERLEVISFNEAMGRYEFQVVTDYAPGKTPVVKYANRAVCVACHQDGGPLFPEYTWAETNENAYIGLIMERDQAAQSYHGLPLRSPAFSGVTELDRSVREAHVSLALQKAWTLGCSGEAQAQVECRALILESGLRRFLGLGASMQAPANWVVDWRTFATEALGPSSGLDDPRGAFPATFIAEADADLDAIKQEILAYGDVRGELDPLSPRPKERFFDREVRDLLAADGWEKVVQFAARQLNRADRALLQAKLGSGAEGTAKLAATVQILRQRTLEGVSDVLGARPLARGVIFPELLAALGATDTRPSCCAAPTPEMAAPILEGDESGGGGRSELATLRHYCAACHTSPPHDFFAGDDERVLAALSLRRDAILRRLELPASDPQAMPLPSSAQREELMRPENIGKVLEMQIVIRNMSRNQ